MAGDDGGPELREATGGVALVQVGARHAVAEREQHLGDAAHADAADADEMHAPLRSVHRRHSVQRRSSGHPVHPTCPATMRSNYRSTAASSSGPCRSERAADLGHARSGVGTAERARPRRHRPPARRRRRAARRAPPPGARRSRSRSRIRRAAPASTRTSALRRWWSSAAQGYGTRMDGRPIAVISAQLVAPARATTTSAAR